MFSVGVVTVVATELTQQTAEVNVLTLTICLPAGVRAGTSGEIRFVVIYQTIFWRLC